MKERIFATPDETSITIEFKDGGRDEDMDTEKSDKSGPDNPGACFEGLAITLIQHLASSDGGNDHGMEPKVWHSAPIL